MKHCAVLSVLMVLVLSACGKDTRPCITSTFTESWPMEESFDWTVSEALVVRCDSLSDNTVFFRSVWDKDSIYFHFDVEDTRLWAFETEQDSPRLWQDDIVEFLIDAEDHHSPGWRQDDIIYHFNILGQKKDDRGCPDGSSDAAWNGEARWILNVHGTICDNSDTDKGYDLTVAVPWSEIGRKAVPGTEIGFNFGCDDNDGVEVLKKPLFCWVNCEPTRSPEQFGKITLRL